MTALAKRSTAICVCSTSIASERYRWDKRTDSRQIDRATETERQSVSCFVLLAILSKVQLKWVLWLFHISIAQIVYRVTDIYTHLQIQLQIQIHSQLLTRASSVNNIATCELKSTFSCIHCRILCAPSDDLRRGPWKFVVKVFFPLSPHAFPNRNELKHTVCSVQCGASTWTGIFSLGFFSLFASLLFQSSYVLLCFCFSVFSLISQSEQSSRSIRLNTNYSHIYNKLYLHLDWPPYFNNKYQDNGTKKKSYAKRRTLVFPTNCLLS